MKLFIKFNLVFLFTIISYYSFAKERDIKPESLIGITTCDASSKYHLHGSFTPFEKDPSAFSFGDMTDGSTRYILVVHNPGTENQCREIVAATILKHQNLQNANSAVGFNCAVLKQPYRRSKSYLAIFQTNALEYTRSIVAWSFNFDTMKFETYSKPSNVYCANFIAD